MTSPTAVGGLNVVDIGTKLIAFSCSHLGRLVNNAEPRWRELALYWVGGHLSELGGGDRNSQPKFWLTPVYYTRAIHALTRMRETNPAIKVKDLTTKEAYRTMLQQIHAAVPSLQPNPVSMAMWRNVNNGLVSPQAREINWKMAHRVLPTNERLASLFKDPERATPKCPFCPLTETLAHRFVECEEVQLVLREANRLLSAQMGVSFQMPGSALVDMTPTGCNDPRDDDLCQIIAGEAKIAIWRQRTDVLYWKKKLGRHDILRLFKAILRLRIRADFLRMPGQRFKDVWCRSSNPAFATVEDGQLKLLC
jgi:hypothetical protein